MIRSKKVLILVLNDGLGCQSKLKLKEKESPEAIEDSLLRS